MLAKPELSFHPSSDLDYHAECRYMPLRSNGRIKRIGVSLRGSEAGILSESPRPKGRHTYQGMMFLIVVLVVIICARRCGCRSSQILPEIQNPIIRFVNLRLRRIEMTKMWECQLTRTPVVPVQPDKKGQEKSKISVTTVCWNDHTVVWSVRRDFSLSVWATTSTIDGKDHDSRPINLRIPCQVIGSS